MSQEQWTAVDQYFTNLLVPADAVLEEALRASDAAGLPQINVAPNQGKLLMLLAQVHQSRTILEIGTLGGYSTIWLARALPSDGHLITLEINPTHAEVARKNIERAGLSSLVEIRIGSALDNLPKIAAEGHKFDLVFIDADKVNTPDYFSWALKMTHRGSLIICDNVVRKGGVIEAGTDDPNIQGIRRFNELLAAEPRVSATAIQTVGVKGYDGFALAYVVAD